MSAYLTGLIVILCLNIIIAYSVFLPAAAGQLNLGAAGFMIIGAYMDAYLNSVDDGLGLPMLLSVPAAALFTALIGFLVSFPILRTRGVYMILATFAFAEIVAGIVLNMEIVGGASGFPVSSHAELEDLLPVTIGVILFGFYLISTRFGLAMRSIHDDESVAILFGVNARHIQVGAFTIGAFLGGLAGALYGHQFDYIEVQNWGILFSIFVLLYVLIGGTQTPWGPLIGALFFTFVPELLRTIGDAIGWELIGELRFAVFGAIIVGMMVLRPEGIMTRTFLELLFRKVPQKSPQNLSNNMESV
ncbi:MAG: branched-chain amino acid ABC transporter permease [Rhodospirillaceae bacterium]|nr:branched-chain amino acid ABC transporter permease [Rhodospirillaceae bacterium]|tara:strand:- start:164 stop:1072 length:909 start_codon:yes stop_codon:yes gene_type:complete